MDGEFEAPTLAHFPTAGSKAVVSLSDVGDWLIVSIPDSSMISAYASIVVTLTDALGQILWKSGHIPAGTGVNWDNDDESDDEPEKKSVITGEIPSSALSPHNGKIINLSYSFQGESNTENSAVLQLVINP